MFASPSRSFDLQIRKPYPPEATTIVGGPASIVTSIERRRQLGSGRTSRLLQGLLLDLPHLHPALPRPPTVSRSARLTR